MSDTIGPVHVKERSSVEMQSRIDAEVLSHLMLSLKSNLVLLFHLSKGRFIPIFFVKC